ncbi:hypothetical protein ACHQM5_019515 [Ranunculus cassubicifolius]
MKELREQSGFGWDENRKMIVVLDDVWEGYVKSHPDAKSYRYKALTNYDDLVIIIGNANAKGGGATTGSELSKAREEQNKSDSDVEEITDGNGVEKNDNKQQMAKSSQTSTTRKRSKTGDAIASAVTEMTVTLKSMVETNKRARLPTVVVEKLCQVISKIPDLDQTLMLEAVDLLANNKTKEHVFDGLPDELKKDWLLMHLKQSKN